MTLWAFDKTGNSTRLTALADGDRIRLQADSRKVWVVGSNGFAIHARASSFEVRYSVTDSGGLTESNTITVDLSLTEAIHVAVPDVRKQNIRID